MAVGPDELLDDEQGRGKSEEYNSGFLYGAGQHLISAAAVQQHLELLQQQLLMAAKFSEEWLGQSS